MPRSLALRAAAALVPSLLAAAPLLAQGAPAAKRAIRPSDFYRMREVKDPQRSPDGKWVAYVVTVADSARDENDSDLWMASWDGAQQVRLTSGPDGETTPRWSPDGRWLAFLSSRQDSSETTQLWLLDRRGGEAMKVTHLQGDVQDVAWSPDGSRLALVVETDPDELATDSTVKDTTAAKHGGKSTKPKPIVIDRYHFKEDITGYLGKKRTHLWLLDATGDAAAIAARTPRLATPGDGSEQSPAWSPDGRRLAFASKRPAAPGEDVDRGENWDLFVMEARPGAAATRLTTSLGPDAAPENGRFAWSPDGARLAYVRGVADPKMYAYQQMELAVVSSSGGEPRALAASLDRAVSSPAWTADGKGIVVRIEDDRVAYPARVDAATGAVARLLTGSSVIEDFDLGRDGGVAALLATDSTPNEVVAIEKGTMRRLSHQNDAWLAGLQLAPVRDFTSHSSDGAEVHGLIALPASWSAGRRVPALLRIHGGPNAQEEHAFHFERQLYAANGYAVIAANYRGSSGRGNAWQRAILGDWGHKEVLDLLGAVDEAVRSGVADSTRLGIGGWSYGGILTDYTIASDGRFKAATSGAGSALQLSMYGVDQYITQYVAELGQPWQNPDAWMKVSYPFFHADRIHTPTLFLGGERDFNVPLAGSEQMYQALRALGVPAALVVYPGQFHGLTRPTFRVDRVQRYLDWYTKYLGTHAPTSAAATP